MVDTNDRRMRGAGGTPGGLGTFFLGFIMIVAGGYLLTNQVMVTSGAWRWWGYNAFGLSLLPLLLGAPGDLLSPHQPVQYVAHAGPSRRWPRPGRPVSTGVVSTLYRRSHRC